MQPRRSMKPRMEEENQGGVDKMDDAGIRDNKKKSRRRDIAILANDETALRQPRHRCKETRRFSQPLTQLSIHKS